ncbi:hypothetical protein GCM10010390_13360 [Streptomyces mordarskii]|uniref:Uncharacterized protein n=1 Tax=Streptomyces mordarskii TaxID=1226758 RepID=A0ABN1C601_9ACTN
MGDPDPPSTTRATPRPLLMRTPLTTAPLTTAPLTTASLTTASLTRALLSGQTAVAR